MSDWDKLREHLENTEIKPDWCCQYIEVSNAGGYFTVRQCEKRATQQMMDRRWMCDEHAHDQWIREKQAYILSFNPVGVKRLTVKGRFGNHG